MGELGRTVMMIVICIAMFAAGAFAASGYQLASSERAAVVADNHTLREANKTLRAQCPARPRLQRGPFVRGSTA